MLVVLLWKLIYLIEYQANRKYITATIKQFVMIIIYDIVLLITNLNTNEVVVIGRTRIKSMHCNIIDCEILIGIPGNRGSSIPSINLTYFYIILLFNLQRTQ